MGWYFIGVEIKEGSISAPQVFIRYVVNYRVLREMRGLTAQNSYKYWRNSGSDKTHLESLSLRVTKDIMKSCQRILSHLFTEVVKRLKGATFTKITIITFHSPIST